MTEPSPTSPATTKKKERLGVGGAKNKKRKERKETRLGDRIHGLFGISLLYFAPSPLLPLRETDKNFRPRIGSEASSGLRLRIKIDGLVEQRLKKVSGSSRRSRPHRVNAWGCFGFLGGRGGSSSIEAIRRNPSRGIAFSFFLMFR